MPTPLNLVINGSEQENGDAVGRCKLEKQLCKRGLRDRTRVQVYIPEAQGPGFGPLALFAPLSCCWSAPDGSPG
jgi:hypothetical protein